jgi:hypothetical protein
MERHVITGLYVVVLVAVIVCVGFLFFKREFWERGEHRNCLGIHSFLFAIHKDSMTVEPSGGSHEPVVWNIRDESNWAQVTVADGVKSAIANLR